MPQHNKFSAAT